MRYREPEPAARSLLIFRGPTGDPTVEAQLTGDGDLRLLSIRRDGVWMYSEIDTIGWWTWRTVRRADLPELVGQVDDVLAAVQAAVAPADDETGVVLRFEAWLSERGVPYTRDSWDEHEP